MPPENWTTQYVRFSSTEEDLHEEETVEFEAFLECGILAHGFLRLRCGECAHEKLVAFSCTRRGFCPACGVRRMTETAAHLVEQVIPHGIVNLTGFWQTGRHENSNTQLPPSSFSL